MRATFFFAALAFLAAQAHAQSLHVVGYSGELGEWELSAAVTVKVAGRTEEFSGPLTMRHVGICTQEGPEEKAGEMRFKLSRFPSEMKATILVDGVECRYSGRLSDRYTGSLDCPDRKAVPLTLWLK